MIFKYVYKKKNIFSILYQSGFNIPGGYNGCGHGHAGHPGRRHWSCCGNVLQNSECNQPDPYHCT